MKSWDLTNVGILIIIVGMVLIFAGILKGNTESKNDTGGEIRGGGIVLIGPIPIIFGTDRKSVKSVIILTIILMLTVYFLFRRF